MKKDNQRVLILHGGWDGHQPEVIAKFIEDQLLNDFDVVSSSDLDMLSEEVLSEYDLLLPIWTFGKLSENQEAALLGAVENGLGLVAWHGVASAFQDNRKFKFMLGGQFVDHPGGDAETYTVRFHNNDALVKDLEDLTITSEQYYLLTDPAIKVLASTFINGAEMDWVKGVEMPVVWTRQWGKGRVFYSALGHTPEILKQASVKTLLIRALHWASCNS